MNKSKFLKRSLAALLAILMVVAMIPGALAADDDTTAPAKPAYTVVVNNQDATFADGGFNATVYGTYILSVALYDLPAGVKVDLLTKNNNVVPLTSTTAIDLKQEATLVSESERTYSVKLRETNAEGTVEYPLTVKVEDAVPVNDVSVVAVRAKEGTIIDSEIGDDIITLKLPLGDDKADVEDEGGNSLTGLTEVSHLFVPANLNATATYNNTAETVTVRAADGSTKTYKLIFKNETGFETFTVDGQIVDTEISNNGLSVNIVVPKTMNAAGLKKITPNWTVGENVNKVYSNGTKKADGSADRSTLGSANSIPGVKSGRGEYNFDTAVDNTITFYVETKATAAKSPASATAVQVTVTETEQYVGTEIINYSPIINGTNGDNIPLATNYDVKATGTNTMYMPVGYNFLAGDMLSLEVRVSKGAVPSIPTQSNPAIEAILADDTDSDFDIYVFYDDRVYQYGNGKDNRIQTSGKGFTIQVNAQDPSVPHVSYKVEMKAAGSASAGWTGYQFQIGGHDGKSMTANFDRNGTQVSQDEMTIKVPYGTLNGVTANSGDDEIGEIETDDEHSQNDIITTYTGYDENGSDDQKRAYATLDISGIDWDVVKESIENVSEDAPIWIKFAEGTKDTSVGTISLMVDEEEISSYTIPSDERLHTGDLVVNFTGGLGSLTINSGYWYDVGKSEKNDVILGGMLDGSYDGEGFCWGEFSGRKDARLTLSEDGTYFIAYTGKKYIAPEVSTPGAPDDDFAGKENGTTVDSKAVYASVSDGASIYVITQNYAPGKTDYSSSELEPIWSSITTFGDLYQYATSQGSDPNKSGVIHILVQHGSRNANRKVYNIKLEENAPSKEAKITAPVTIGSTAVIGEMNEYTGTPAEKTTSTGNSVLRVAVPYEWDNNIDATNPGSEPTYIYKELKISDGATAYVKDSNNKLVKVAVSGTDIEENGLLSSAVIQNQDTGSTTNDVVELDVDPALDIAENGQRPVIKTVSEKIYVVSEDANKLAAGKIGGFDEFGTKFVGKNVSDIADYANIYYVYYERGTARSGAELKSIMSNTSGVTATLNPTTKVVNVRVPSSFNWTTYRNDDSSDFTLDFTLDEGASMVSKSGTDIDWTSGKTVFFVKDSELYVFDKLTGIKTQITNKGAKPDTSGVNHEPQASSLVVTSQNGKVSNTYSFRLTIAQPSSDAGLSKVVVGETEAVISGTNVTVTLPAGSDLTAQDVHITPTSSVATVQNDKGEAFNSTVKHNLTNGMKFTITAEDGTTKAEYTLTATVSGSTDPNKKPSESYTDLDKVYSGHRERVIYAIDNGLMSNDGTAGVFNSEGKIARRDFALIIARADMRAENPDAEDVDALLREKYADTPDAFDDIASLNPTQKAALAYCKEKNIINGNGKGGFNPAGAVSREDAAIMIAGWCGLEHTDTANTNNIKDWDSVSSWAKPFVNAAYKAGLMNGTGNDNFTPARNLNRGEAAYIIVGALNQKAPGSN